MFSTQPLSSRVFGVSPRSNDGTEFIQIEVVAACLLSVSRLFSSKTFAFANGSHIVHALPNETDIQISVVSRARAESQIEFIVWLLRAKFRVLPYPAASKNPKYKFIHVRECPLIAQKLNLIEIQRTICSYGIVGNMRADQRQ